MNQVRVFRRIERGTPGVRYEFRSFSGHGGGVHDTIGEAARAVKARVLENGGRQVASVTIVFHPEHGMEWPLGQTFACRCEPLRPAEQHEFYEAFVKEDE